MLSGRDETGNGLDAFMSTVKGVVSSCGKQCGRPMMLCVTITRNAVIIRICPTPTPSDAQVIMLSLV